MIQDSIKSLMRSFGVEVGRTASSLAEQPTLQRLLRQFQIDMVLDVGANTGQYARMLRRLGYRGQILSFEALSAAHASLCETAAHDPLWRVAPRAAVGAVSAETEINISQNSVSSSLLPMLDLCTDAADHARYVAREAVSVRTLESLCKGHLGAADKALLKIDTQGYEDQVLAGAGAVLERTSVIQSEVSLTALYDHSKTMEQIIAQVKALGFEPWSLTPGFADRDTGRLLQCDVYFVRKSIAPENSGATRNP